MPTPFYHLQTAEDLLVHPGLPGHIRRILTAQHSEFLFGNIAPDVQVISHQSREATHFFTLPFVASAKPAWKNFLETYPSLADPRQLSPKQAAFISGYACHLNADWLWIRDIFNPIFGPASQWSTFWHRLYVHNVLRTYMDFRIMDTLKLNEDALLDEVVSKDWLPFVEDKYLIEWRKEIFDQLKPGAVSHTVDVFAERQGIAPEEYYRLLNSEEAMQAEVFSHISPQVLEDYRQTLLAENLHLLENYFKDLADSWPVN